jgi:type IV secretion system protein TrbL
MRATLFLLLMASMPVGECRWHDGYAGQSSAKRLRWLDVECLGYATNLFFGLAAIEFAWSAIQLTLKKSELSEIMVGTLFKVMSLSFFAMVSDQGARVDSCHCEFIQGGGRWCGRHHRFVALGGV